MNDFDEKIGFDVFGEHSLRLALMDVNDTVGYVKKILLSNRVQHFTSADVVAMTAIVFERQMYYKQKEGESFRSKK